MANTFRANGGPFGTDRRFPDTPGLRRGIGTKLLPLTSAAFEALVEYDANTRYIVAGDGEFVGATRVAFADWSPPAGDVYVAKTGNDTTGTGTYANPYLTIKKGFDVVAAAGGKTVWVGAGTYAEDAGSGYLGIHAKAFTATVTVRAVPGDSVILTNVSSVYVLRFTGTSNRITFRDIEFRRTGSITNYIHSSGTVSLSNLSFVECRITEANSIATHVNLSSSSATHQNISFKRCSYSGTGVCEHVIDRANGVSIIGCAWTQSGAVESRCVRLLSNVLGSLRINSNRVLCTNATGGTSFALIGVAGASTLEMLGNTIESLNGISILGASSQTLSIDLRRNLVTCTNNAVLLNGFVTGGNISENTVRGGSVGGGGGGGAGLGCPSDGASANVDSVVVRYNQISSKKGHSLLVSFYGTNITVEHNTSDARGGGDFGLVLKGEDNTVQQNTFYGGSGSAIYLKGAQDCTVEDCVLVQSVSGHAIEFAEGNGTQTGVAPAGNTLGSLDVSVSAGDVFNVPNTLNAFGSNNTIDENIYRVSGTGVWGIILGTTVASLAAVRAAWTALYASKPNNDGTSSAP